MSRLTKNISDKQTYCGYEVKKCKYQQIYDFERYDELEDYVDCDLTLAVDKLGKLEDLEEKYDLPLDVLITLMDHYYYYDEDGNQKFFHSLDMYHKQIVIKKYENDDDIYGYYEHLNFKDYKVTWWINKDKE